MIRKLAGRRSAIMVIAALTIVGSLATGCSGHKAAASAVPDDAQPFSLFLGDKLGLVDYAQLKVQNVCLRDAGYPQNLRIMLEQPRNPFDNLVITPRSFGPTSEAEARRIGFGTDSRSTPASLASFDVNFDKAMDKCSGAAWDKLGKDAYRTYLKYFDLGNALGEPYMKLLDERVGKQNWQKLLTCLNGKGYRTAKEDEFLRSPEPRLLGVPIGDSAADPADDWKPKEVPGTVEVGPPIPARQYRASAAEGALAVAWFQCRRDTGVDQIEQQDSVAVQKELVAKNEPAFDELNPAIEQVAKQAAKLIA